MAFRAGQKVVCVHAGDRGGLSPGRWDDGEEVIEGDIYTIHSIFQHPHRDETLVRLYEVRRTAQSQEDWGHDGYAAERFRPIVARKTDISALKAILVPVAKIREDA